MRTTSVVRDYAALGPRRDNGVDLDTKLLDQIL
jgi:hypothetical protein